MCRPELLLRAEDGGSSATTPYVRLVWVTLVGPDHGAEDVPCRDADAFADLLVPPPADLLACLVEPAVWARCSLRSRAQRLGGVPLGESAFSDRPNLDTSAELLVHAHALLSHQSTLVGE